MGTRIDEFKNHKFLMIILLCNKGLVCKIIGSLPLLFPSNFGYWRKFHRQTKDDPNSTSIELLKNNEISRESLNMKPNKIPVIKYPGDWSRFDFENDFTSGFHCEIQNIKGFDALDQKMNVLALFSEKIRALLCIKLKNRAWCCSRSLINKSIFFYRSMF